MAKTMNDILHPGANVPDPDFPHSPEGWDRQAAGKLAEGEGIELDDKHWAVLAALHEYFDKHNVTHMRELHDALEEKFHHLGGMRRLYQLFPGGPVAQGCRIAGLEPPPGSVDESYGSVQ